jgi:hypothetical protein
LKVKPEAHGQPAFAEGSGGFNPSILVVTMSCAATARQRYAVGAKKLSGNFNHFKTAAALTRDSFIGWFGFH